MQQDRVEEGTAYYAGVILNLAAGIQAYLPRTVEARGRQVARVSMMLAHYDEINGDIDGPIPRQGTREIHQALLWDCSFCKLQDLNQRVASVQPPAPVLSNQDLRVINSSLTEYYHSIASTRFPLEEPLTVLQKDEGPCKDLTNKFTGTHQSTLTVAAKAQHQTVKDTFVRKVFVFA